jgi:hypothetical protein
MTEGFRAFIRAMPDEIIRRPLWDFAPEAALDVLRERARRGFHDLITTDPADPEYS